MKRMKRERKRLGLTQAQLAGKAYPPLHPTTISKMEHGSKAWPGQAKRLARALEWEGDPSELFDDCPDEEE